MHVRCGCVHPDNRDNWYVDFYVESIHWNSVWLAYTIRISRFRCIFVRGRCHHVTASRAYLLRLYWSSYLVRFHLPGRLFLFCISNNFFLLFAYVCPKTHKNNTTVASILPFGLPFRTRSLFPRFIFFIFPLSFLSQIALARVLFTSKSLSFKDRFFFEISIPKNQELLRQLISNHLDLCALL